MANRNRELVEEPGESFQYPEMEWDEMDRPGCYLLVDSGDLVRVPREALTPGSLPVITIISRGAVKVARVSNNPAEPLEILRRLASRNGYYVNF